MPVSQSSSSFSEVWASSTGLIFMLSAPIQVLVGLLLSNLPSHRHTLLAQTLSFSSALSFAFFSLVIPIAGNANNVPAVVTAVAALAIPLGVGTVVCVDHPRLWLPRAFGTAIALITVSQGLGTMFSAWLFQQLVDSFPIWHAIRLAGLIYTTAAILSAFFIRYPHTSTAVEQDEQGLNQRMHITEEYHQRDFTEKYTSGRMLRLPAFWQYVFCIFTAGAAYPLLSYYFKLGYVFKQSPHVLLPWFQAATFLSIVFNLVVSLLSHRLHFGQGIFTYGGRNLMGTFLILQSLMFSILLIPSQPSQFLTFAVCCFILQLLYQGNYAVAALFASDMFGAANMPMAFGVGAGIAFGTGEGVATFFMTKVENFVTGVHKPVDYFPFYVIGAVWSIVCFFVMLLLRPVRRRVDISCNVPATREPLIVGDKVY